MAKFIIGVVVGIFLGASGSVYGAVAAGSGASSGWTIAEDGEAIIVPDRHGVCRRDIEPLDDAG